MRIRKTFTKANGIKTRMSFLFILFSFLVLIQIAVNNANLSLAIMASSSHSISVLQYADRIEASATGGGIDGESWRNNYAVASTSSPDCSNTTFGATSSSAKVVAISNSDVGKWVCFTVKHSNPAVSIYGKYQITASFSLQSASLQSAGPASAPLITVTQKDGNGNVLTATSSDTDLPANPDWQYSNPLTKDTNNNEPDCTSSTVNWFKGNKVKYIEYDKYYCFKVADDSGNVGYARFKTKPAAPVLTSDIRIVPPSGANPPKQVIRASAIDNIPALQANEEFGSSLSSDGSRFVVGAPKQAGSQSNQVGAVYVYAKKSNQWILEQHIYDESTTRSFNYLGTGDNFGQAVAIEGDWLVVGAPGDDSHSGANTGAVYIFRKHPVGWVVTQRIYDTYAGFTTLEAGDKFGSSLALSGDRLVVGAPGDDGHSGANTGAAYVFKLTDETWVLEREIADANTGFTALEAGDKFGQSLALDGRWLAVGGPAADGASRDDTGAVYIFKKTRSTWAYKQKISDESTDFKSLWAGDEFGSALSLEGRTLVVGSSKATWLSVRSGAAYVFTRGQYSDTFSFQQEISRGNSGLGTSIQAGDKFGASVDLSGDRLAVSAIGDSTTGMSNTGAVYIFKKTSGNWSLEQELSYDTSLNFLRAGDALGTDVVLAGSWLLASAPLDDGVEGSNSGAVYILKKDSNDSWSDQSKLHNNGITIKADSWQNFKTSDTTEPDCDSNDTFGTAASTANEVDNPVTNTENKWACFRVQTQADSTIYGYIKHQFDYNKPSISGWMDAAGNLVVSGSDENMRPYSNWSVSASGGPGRGSNLNNLCDLTARIWWGASPSIGSTKKLSYVNYGAWYCVSLRDTVENYRKAKFQATLPIAVSQTSTTATASVPEDIYPHLANEDKLGSGVSLDGDWMVAGAPGDDGQSGSNTGAVYIFKRSGKTWILKQKISDKASGFTALQAGDKFGTAVSLSGSRFAVGAPEDDVTSKANAGAVYIFKKGSNDVWSLEETIDANHTRDIKANAAFGQSVSLDGEYLAVGAPGHQASAPSNDEAYVFKKKAGANDDWEKQKKIDNSQTGLNLTINNIQGEPGQFGIGVSLDGAYLAIGAPGYDIRRDDSEETIISNSSGAISIFQRTGSSWSEVDYIHEKYYQKQQYPIQGPQKTNFLDEGDNFGISLSLDGDYLAVGAIGDNGRGYGTNKNYGAVHILERSGNTWNHQKEIAKNEIPSLVEGAQLGNAIDIDVANNRLAIGAKKAKSHRTSTQTKTGGEVYVFTKSGSSWNLERAFTLRAEDDVLADVGDEAHLWSTLDKLGSSIALDGDYLVAGAPGDQGSRYEDSTTDTFGAVHTFYRQPGQNWTFGNRLKNNPVKLAATNPWGYFKTQTAAAPDDCDSSGTFTDITSGSSVSLASNDQWVCFRVKSPQLPGASGNFISYRAYKILDVSAPTIALVQDNVNGLIVASSSGLPEESFEYFVSSTDPTCSASNTTATYTVNHFATNLTANQWVCFRAQSLNGVFGYAKKQIDLTPPVIDIHKTENRIRALSGATDLPDSPVWQKKGPQNHSDCDASTTFTSGDRFDIPVGARPTGKYYCFSVTDENGNRGFGEIKVGVTDPILSVSQTKGSPNKISAGVSNHSSIDVDTDSWQSFKTSDATEPNCDSDDKALFGTASSTADEVTTTSSDNGEWACFRVKTDDNIYGYAKQEIDYDAPSIQIALESATSITATSDATDLPASPVWQKSGPHNSSDCDSSTTGFTTGNSLNSVVISKYYCFKVTDKNDNDGYAEIQIPNAPIITITQNRGTSSDTISATAWTFSADGVASASWKHFIDISSEPNCDANDSFNSTGNTITNIVSIHNGQWVCFKVKNDNNNDEYGYAKYQVDLNGPTIYISQVGTTITAHTDTTDLPSTPAWKKTAARNASDCDAATSGFSSGNSITGVQSAEYYCFKLADKIGNEGFGEIEIGEAPVLSLTQSQSDINASATTTGTLDNDSWQFFKTPNIYAPTCDQDDQAQFGSASSSGNTTTIQSSENNRWICFRVKNSNNVYGYYRHQIDYNPPVVNVSKVGTTLTAHSDDADLLPASSAWQKRFSQVDTDCDDSASGFTTDAPRFANVADTVFYCFKATDKNGNSGYRGLYIGEVPEVVITQTQQTQATASATSTKALNTASWQHFKTSDTTEPNCDQDDKALFGEALSSSNSARLNSSDNNRWVCFRVKNSNEIYGYAKKKLAVTYSPPSSPPTIPPGAIGPQLVITQDGDRLSVSATDASGFAYFISDTDPDCSASNQTAVYIDGQTTTSLTDKQWACFKAKNAANIYSYAKYQIAISTVAPNTPSQLILTQVGNSVEATGTNLTDFAFFVLDSQPDCQSSEAHSLYAAGSVASGLLNNQWVCFRAQDAAGSFVYEKLQVILPPSEVEPQTPNEPASSEDNLPASQPPSSDDLVVNQTGRSAVASSETLADFQYFLSRTEPDCSDNNTDAAYIDGQVTRALFDGQWVCFRARNDQNQYSYTKFQAAVLSPPLIADQPDDAAVDPVPAAARTSDNVVIIVLASWLGLIVFIFVAGVKGSKK